MQKIITELLKKLIGFDTTSRNSNLDFIDFVSGYLRDAGIESRLVRSEAGDKANLYATIGPNVQGGVVLSGHTDVVPVDGQDWGHNPFDMWEDSGRLYGRGTSDMKGFIAVALAHVPALAKAGLKRPVHLAFSFDEEVGCLGIQSMLGDLKDNIAPPCVVIVGEPTGMKVANAHKGQYVSRTRVWGREAHSSRPEDGLNAVEVAADLIGFLGRMRDDARHKGIQDEAFDTPYTSFNVGPIKGGSAFNIIPNSCEFEWEFRLVPGDDGEAHLKRYQGYIDTVINPRLKSHFPQCHAENEVWAYLPPLLAAAGSDAEVLALALAGRNETTVVAFGTEAGHFQSIDFPAVVCGPGDIAQAHKPNEYIEIRELMACSRFMDRLRENLS